jgi:hypothetical protein
LVIGLVAVGTGAGGSQEPRRVEGQVMMEHSICRGGVAVTREDMERLPPPVPIAGREFLVVSGDRISARRPAARFVSRADGTFVARLPPGQWCFFDAARRPESAKPLQPVAPRKGRSVDQGCLEQERLRCDLVLVVRSDIKRARITFTERCPQAWAQPCYHGPMPP